MSRCNQLSVLFCIQIFFGLLNAIVSNEDVFKNMSLEYRRFFFGTEDGAVPEYQMVKLAIPSRSKRSIDPLAIDFDYYGKPATTILNVVQDHNLIGRAITGVWAAGYDANAHHNVFYTPRPDVIITLNDYTRRSKNIKGFNYKPYPGYRIIFEQVGEYDMFQNVDDSSAVTRFVDSAGRITISGVLRQAYVIKSLPLCYENGILVNSCVDHESRNGRSANSNNQDTDYLVKVVIFKIPDVPMEYFRRHSNARNLASPNLDLHRERRQNANPTYFPNVVFPKLLIIPDHSVIRGLNVVDYVRQIIAHVNAVDMMYRQLHHPEVRLTISGIILPWDYDAQPYIASHVEQNGYVNALNVLNSVVSYFFDEKNRFPYDLHNAVVVLTGYKLYTVDNTGNSNTLGGIANMNSACRDVAAAITQYSSTFKGILVMAHELGHVLGVEHDGEGMSQLCRRSDGYTMAPGDPWAKLLQWSECSREAFRSFFRSWQATCMYNRPNEIPNPKNSMQGSWLSINGQCDNFFKDSRGYCWLSNSCSTFGCGRTSRNNDCTWINQSPMEGSPGPGGYSCINQQWRI